MAVTQEIGSALAGPPIDPAFVRALDELTATASKGHKRDSQFFNPSNEWLIGHMRIFQDLPPQEQEQVLQEAEQITRESERLNGEGKAGVRVWPDIAVRLDSGGLGFFSQFGVARRPDLTQYFIDGFSKNRDALAFSASNQALFAKILPYITALMKQRFASGDTIIQTDRQVGDAPGRSFHARQLLFGTDYPQLPYMWRQLTFDVPDAEIQEKPHILEVSIPKWLDDLGLPQDLKDRVQEAGLTQLIFKAPTKGLSLHLGFDYMGEHKMGPLSVAMFLVKQSNGLAVQAALSMARVKTLDGNMTNAALITTGPSLHGKSTLTIMIELPESDLSGLLGLTTDADEGIYPMNDDIVLLQRLDKPTEVTRGGKKVKVSYGIDGTENNLYAVPFGLTQEADPITYDVLRGSEETPNSQETLENVPFNAVEGAPDFLHNPVRNMRMLLSRSRLLARKGVAHLPNTFTDGRLNDTVHVPMESTDKVLWQGVMRQNTVVPPLVRLNKETYVRALMYGEAVQTGAATGAIGRPYVEYFSDPFIIGLEDENANLMYKILQDVAQGGMTQEFYMFNTGGLGADRNEEASGPLYKKITRELTLMLQEAVLRGAVKFEEDPVLGVDVAAAIVNSQGEEVLDLRKEWLPREIYGEAEYRRRVVELKHKRFYGENPQDKAGILRYTKVSDAIFDIDEIPVPSNERELAWLLSFYWNVDQAYNSLADLAGHLSEGQRPANGVLKTLGQKYRAGVQQGLKLAPDGQETLPSLGMGNLS
ncbi:MAG: phosphoenolpyruvate carboxykinase (ATP) [Chloroflexi bacterium]|nr:phosphoenolpyruvate carboxykinase (ATP) [Chloroflexota bacterium]